MLKFSEMILVKGAQMYTVFGNVQIFTSSFKFSLTCLPDSGGWKVSNRLENLLFVVLVALMMAAVVCPVVEARPLKDLRQDFLKAEKYIVKKDDENYFKLAEQLKDYPLYPYLQYQWLSKNLEQSRAVQQFLLNYRSTRYAALLKNKWLGYLAKKKDWPQLIKHYRSSSSPTLQCYYYLAKYNSGQKKTALTAARKLWVVGKSQPAVCDPLFKHLKASKYFTRELLWQRFQAALGKGKVQLAKYVRGLMGKKDRKSAELWLKVHQNPKKILQTDNWHRGYKQAGLMFAHAIDRIARRNSSEAARIWDQEKEKYTIPDYRARQIERRLAIGLAFRRDKDAYSRIEKLPRKDAVVREWQVRTALAEQNWQHVGKSLANLSAGEKNKTNWRYWQARLFEESGKTEQATRIFKNLASDRSFYGFLSASKLDRAIDIFDQPLKISPEEINKLAQRLPFQMVSELTAINRNLEAKRQWWYVVSRLKRKDIMVAAKLAEQWQWNQVAIFTIARAKHWDDVGLRFPIKYSDQVRLNATKQGLDPAIVFGLIRRESAFDEKARSPVGARGLMQIMPRTGRQIARDLKEKWQAETSLFNPDTNVRYGTFYYKQLLERFHGHYALAAAAYNAGPHRVKRWLPENKAVAADIWIETIPFRETRGYVSAVLTYALIYQQRLQRNVLKIKDFMRDVLPERNLS